MQGELFVLADGNRLLCRKYGELYLSSTDSNYAIFYKELENAKKMHKDRVYLEQYDIDPSALVIKKVEIDIIFKGTVNARYKV